MTGEIQNFDYDINHSFETNFNVWFQAANKERFDWNEDPLSIRRSLRYLCTQVRPS